MGKFKSFSFCFKYRWDNGWRGETSLQNTVPVKQTLSSISIWILEEFSSLCTTARGPYFQLYLFKVISLFGPHTFIYFKSSSNTILRFSAYTLWPSLLIFFSHFYSFQADYGVNAPRGSAEDLFLAIFSPRDIKNILVSPLLPLGRGRMRPIQSGFYSLVFHIPSVTGRRINHVDNCWNWGSRPCPGPLGHIPEAHHRNGVIAVCTREVELRDSI